MPVRISAGKHLEVLEPSELVGLPIEVDIFDGANPATMLATMENAREAALQVQLSEVGSGRFRIARSDPKATASILAKGNLVKVRVGGKHREAWWIEEPTEVLTSKDEASGEDVQLAGRGALAYLERAVVYPPIWPTQPAAFRAVSSASNAGGNTISIAAPSGLVNGDTLIAAVVFALGSDRVITGPPGWVAFQRIDNGTDLGLALFVKSATSGDAALPGLGGGWSWSFNGLTNATGQVIALYNASPDFIGYRVASAQLGSGTAITNPSVDVGSVDGMLLALSGATAGTGMTPPVGMTETSDIYATGRALESARLAGPILGPTGDKTTTNSASGAWIGVQLFIPSTATSEAVFAGETPGGILQTLIDRAQARGSLGHLTYDFDGTADSQGEPWPDTFDLSFHIGTTLLDVWRQLVGLGMEGYCSHGLRLSAFVDRRRDRTSDVIFRKGYHLLGEVANISHHSGVRSRLLVEGAGGRVVEVSAPATEADPLVGRREGFLPMATSDAATDLARAGEQALALTLLEDQARLVPVAHGLLTEGHYEPWEDYRLGDEVGLDADGTGVYTVERIAGWTIAQREALDYSVVLDLNSVALEAMVRMRRELDALRGTGGGGSAGSSLSLGGGGGGGGSATSGLVLVQAGDTPGHLYDKIEAMGILAKSLGGTPSSRRVVLDASAGLDDLTDVDAGAPGDGDALVYDSGPGLWVPTPVATGSNRPFLDQAALHGTYGDDFDVASLNARWTRRNLSGTDETYQQGGGSYMRVALPSGVADRMYLQPWSNPTNAELILSLTDFGNEGTSFMFGLIAVTSAGAGVALSPYNDGNGYTWAVSSYAYSSTGQTLASWTRRIGLPLWLRLRKAGTSWYGSMSRDGRNWSPETAAHSFASATDRIGFGRIFNTGAQTIAVDRFNVVNVS